MCPRPGSCSPATPCSAVGLVPPDGRSRTFPPSWIPSAIGCSHCPRRPGCTPGTATAPPSAPRRPISPNGSPEGIEAVTHADERGADETDLVVTHEKSYAAGIPAVAVSLRRGLKQMGALRTARTLLKLNQRNGFDCPGCAWPETPGHRKHAEFCENGAKAVAEEATTRTVTPTFFAAHPVSELLQKTDYWLGQQGRLTHPMVLLPGRHPLRADRLGRGVQLDRRRAAALARSRRGGLLHLGPHLERGGVPVPAAGPRRSAPTTCPTARTCATSRAASALARDDRHRQGDGVADRLRARRPDRWSSARTRAPTIPRMLTALRDSQRPRREGHRDQPAARGGTAAVQGTRRRCTACSARRRHRRLTSCRSASAATRRSSTGWPSCCSRPTTAAPARVLDREFIDAHSAGFDAYAEHIRAVDLRRPSLEATGLSPRRRSMRRHRR